MLEVGGAGCRRQRIEARSSDQSARSAETFFAFISQLSGWALVAPSCFVLMHQDQRCKVADESLLLSSAIFYLEQIRLSYVYILTVNIIIT